MTSTYADVVEALGDAAGVTRGRMFGAEGLKLGGKVFAMEVKGSLVVKLAVPRAAEIVAGGWGVAFDPGHGRPMRQWVAVPSTAGLDWIALAREALEFAAGR